MTAALLAANFRGIGLTIAAVTMLGFLAVWVRNIVKARPELGSEIELAPNRKEYMSDEELEGYKLDRSLGFALVLLTMLGLMLPFYWLAEPGRQEGAVAAYNASFESRGEGTYTVGAQCVTCHAAGGVGGVAPYVLQDADGQFIANASWQAPALDNVLNRYSEDEVRYILNFGRPGSPMAAWGTPGGGPLTTQQVNNVIVYLRTLQSQSVDPIDITLAGDPNDAQDDESLAAQVAADEVSAAVMEEVERSIDDGEFETVGEAVFNLGLFSGFQAGAAGCGRCHTAGWSIGVDNVLDEGVAGCGGGNPSGIGYNLCASSTTTTFPDDTWLLPDGSWYRRADYNEQLRTVVERGNPVDYDGTYLLAEDGSKVTMNDKGTAVTSSGEPYWILDATEDNPERSGDLAECAYVSQLWEYGGISDRTTEEEKAWAAENGLAPGQAYAFAMDEVLATNDDGAYMDPEPVTAEQIGEDAIVMSSGQILADCDIIEMPPRTSQAHFDFIAAGAEAGKGYGEGGLSGAGMMPGFGKVLPPELIEAVVNYERGL